MSQKSVSPIAGLMALRGITQKDIAEALEVSEQTVSNWMTGRTIAKLTFGDWRKLAKVLDCELENLPDSLSPIEIEKSRNQS
ncbi:helix-turn-helix transcriptional regulator [Pseudanabaena sp. BC1403]|uniref:helix-turn-helix transcriptional regulator n=1 Tax=Pseudanabaena sp. BC1403 TaxID=2043171 RepID=UPI000CD939C1|nr:helix-turn-helix transcriptional regulator [Pseudanabaena sp. BC1403]